MTEKFLKFSFSLPVYNAQEYLERCLKSIRKQDYPQDKIEILLVDGGSTDKTLDIAAKFNVKIFDNPKRLADFGAKISVRESSGDLFVIFAADNELASDDWLKTMADLFTKDNHLSAAWCKMVASSDDRPINRYYELIQNDPLSFFVNKNQQNYLKSAELAKVNKRDCFIFSVDKAKPLIWGANGLVYRKELVRGIILRDGFLGDNDVFQIMIEQGQNKVAYIPNLYVYHHHLKGISQWVSKWRRNYVSHFLTQRKSRNLNWVVDENFTTKLFLWTLYSSIPIFSLLHSIYLSIKDKDIHWLYHPAVSFMQMATYLSLTISEREGRGLIKDLILKRNRRI